MGHAGSDGTDVLRDIPYTAIACSMSACSMNAGSSMVTRARARGPLAGVSRSRVQVQAFLNVFKNTGGSARSVQARKNALIKSVLARIETTERGTKQGNAERAAILADLGELRELSQEDSVNPDLLNGTWRLLWTTEKEILAIIKDGGIANWCGTSAGDVLQVIDLREGRLQNCIEFPPEGAFLVDSSIQFDEDEKCSFAFRGAALKLPKRVIRLPPMGKSRFQTIYVSKTTRVAFDDRGDYLVVERVGAPRDLMAGYEV